MEEVISLHFLKNFYWKERGFTVYVVTNDAILIFLAFKSTCFINHFLSNFEYKI